MLYINVFEWIPKHSWEELGCINIDDSKRSCDPKFSSHCHSSLYIRTIWGYNIEEGQGQRNNSKHTTDGAMRQREWWSKGLLKKSHSKRGVAKNLFASHLLVQWAWGGRQRPPWRGRHSVRGDGCRGGKSEPLTSRGSPPIRTETEWGKGLFPGLIHPETNHNTLIR